MGSIEQYWKDTDNEDWAAFVKICEERWTNSSEQIELIKKLKGNKDIAIVTNYHLGNGATEWIGKHIPVLDNLRPIECLDNDLLKTRLKMALWSFP